MLVLIDVDDTLYTIIIQPDEYPPEGVSLDNPDMFL